MTALIFLQQGDFLVIKYDGGRLKLYCGQEAVVGCVRRGFFPSILFILRTNLPESLLRMTVLWNGGWERLGDRGGFLSLQGLRSYGAGIIATRQVGGCTEVRNVQWKVWLEHHRPPLYWSLSFDACIMPWHFRHQSQFVFFPKEVRGSSWEPASSMSTEPWISFTNCIHWAAENGLFCRLGWAQM